MSIDYSVASANALSVNTVAGGISAEPLTMACRHDNGITGQYRMVIGASGADDRWHLRGAVSGGSRATARATDGTATGEALSPIFTPAAGVWRSHVGVFASTTSRTCYLDGVAGTENTTSVTVGAVNRTVLGSHWRFLGTSDWNNLIQDFAIWDAALNADEAKAYHEGQHPFNIRPGNLVFFLPGVRANHVDLVGGLSMTVTQTVGIAAHNRMRMPGRPSIVTVPAVAVGDPEGPLIDGKLVGRGILGGRLVA